MAGGIDYKTIIYLFLRLIPFILVCFFTLSSIFNQDLVGVIYLAGLLVACFANIIVGGVFPHSEKNEICDLITINNNVLFANLPVGLTIISYTFFYMFYMIINYDLVQQQLTTLILFPLFLISDIIWNIQNNCFNIFNIILSVALGGSIGYGWSAMLDYGKIKNFHFINIEDSNRAGNTCGVLKNEGKMNCFIYKNGHLVGQSNQSNSGNKSDGDSGKGGGRCGYDDDDGGGNKDGGGGGGGGGGGDEDCNNA